MTEIEAIQLLNAVVSPFILFFILLEEVALFLRTAWVIGRYGWRSVPVLQWRDLLLFSTLTVLIGGASYARFTHTALGEQLSWVAFTDVLSIITVVAFVVIEVGLYKIRNQPPKPPPPPLQF